MNCGSFLVGALFCSVWVMSRIEGRESPGSSPRNRLLRAVFLGLNLAVLAFCAIAWINARGSYSYAQQSFNYRNYIKWLPTTYDSALTWQTLANFSACFAVFWSTRLWLTRGWQRAKDRTEEPHLLTALHNRRFAAILWVISINGLVLGVQGLLQRLSGSPNLLWMRLSHFGNAITSFGPFSYYGNAAEYLNMIWPVALAFWWVLSRDRRRLQGSTRTITDGPELMLVPAVIIMTAASIVSLSRGGALIAGGLLLGCFIVIAVQGNISTKAKISAGLVFVGTVAAVTLLGWQSLLSRFRETSVGNMSGRTEIYQNARQIVSDYPVYGTGPGSFRSVYHLYRKDVGQAWHGYLHDDWLETLITFGWIGFSLLVAHLVVLALWVLAREKAPISGLFVIFFSFGLLGCLAHAKFDFPFQTYSIFFTFVVLSSILTTISPQRA